MDILKLLSPLAGAPGIAMAAGKPELLGPLASPAGAGLMALLGGKKGGTGGLGVGNLLPPEQGSGQTPPIAGPGVGGNPPAPLPQISGVTDVGPLATPQMSGYERGVMDTQLQNQLPDPSTMRRGVFDRVGDFIGSDRGKGALLRAGATMLSTGDIGGGIMAGADYVDQQKGLDAFNARDERDFGLKSRVADAGILNDAVGRELQSGQLALNYQIAEINAKQKAAELGYKWAELSEEQRQFMVEDERKRQEEAGRNTRHVTPSGSTLATQAGADRRHATPSGSSLVNAKPVGSIVTSADAVDPVEPGFLSWLTGDKGTPGTPATKQTTQVLPLPPDPAQRIPGVTYMTPTGPQVWMGR